MPNAIVYYCGSTLTKGLIDTLISLEVNPIMVPAGFPLEPLLVHEPIAIFVGGSHCYVNAHDAPTVDEKVWEGEIPVLGICYGMQLMAKALGGKVKRMATPEKELCHLYFFDDDEEAYTYSPLFEDFTAEGAPVWMLHNCKVTELPEGFYCTAQSDETEYAAMENPDKNLYAVQFHPEHQGKDPSVQAGRAIIYSFLKNVCNHVL